MKRERIELLLELISECVDEYGPFAEKAKAVAEVVVSNERWEFNFDEFISWFEPPEGDSQ